MILGLIVLLVSHLPQTICLNKNLEFCTPLWRVEAEKRFSDPVMVFVHGGPHNRLWVAAPDAHVLIPEDLMAVGMRMVYPGRTIVFISCNQASTPLRVSGVWYAKHLVWTRPGTDLRVSSDFPFLEFGTGSIREFISR